MDGVRAGGHDVRRLAVRLAFCRVVPSFRFRVRAMLAARVLFRASTFSVRTSEEDRIPGSLAGSNEARRTTRGLPVLRIWLRDRAANYA
jgi:hypothetical protein